MDTWQHDYDERTTVRFESSEQAERAHFIQSLEREDIPYEMDSEDDIYNRRVFVNRLMSDSEVLKRALGEAGYNRLHAANSFEDRSSIGLRGHSIKKVETETEYL